MTAKRKIYNSPTNDDLERAVDKEFGDTSSKGLVWFVRHAEGAHGQGALAELTRRNAETVRQSSTAGWSLAFAMLMVMLVQIAIAVV